MTQTQDTIRQDKTASKVLDGFHTWEDYADHLAKIDHFPPMAYMQLGYSSKYYKWEALVRTADFMSNNICGRPICANGYSIKSSKDGNKGLVKCNTAYGDTVTVSANVYLAYIKLFIHTCLGLPMTDKQYDLYLDFKSLSSDVYRLMD
jgi:hypothetical protein